MYEQYNTQNHSLVSQLLGAVNVRKGWRDRTFRIAPLSALHYRYRYGRCDSSAALRTCPAPATSGGGKNARLRPGVSPSAALPGAGMPESRVSTPARSGPLYLHFVLCFKMMLQDEEIFEPQFPTCRAVRPDRILMITFESVMRWCRRMGIRQMAGVYLEADLSWFLI